MPPADFPRCSGQLTVPLDGVDLPGDFKHPARHLGRHPDRCAGRGQFTDERKAIFRQVALREIRGRLTRNLVLLLQQPRTFADFT